MPRVSVVVPNFNHARFLDQRLRSILGQTFQDFEVIVLDDASTDDSLAVIRPFLADPRVRLIEGKVNGGSPFRQWNRGVGLAAAELVWIAESDDSAEPGLLAALVERLERHPEVGLAYCESQVIDEDGHVLRLGADELVGLDSARWRRDFLASGRRECAKYLLFRNTIPNASAVVFRKRVFEEMGGADESMRLCGDWHVWTGILLRSDVAFVAQPLNHHRTHPATVRATAGYERSVTEGWRVVEQILGAVVPDPDDLAALRARLANEWASLAVLQQKQALDAALRRFRELARFDPFFAVRAGGQVARYFLTAGARRLGSRGRGALLQKPK